MSCWAWYPLLTLAARELAQRYGVHSRESSKTGCMPMDRRLPAATTPTKPSLQGKPTPPACEPTVGGRLLLGMWTGSALSLPFSAVMAGSAVGPALAGRSLRTAPASGVERSCARPPRTARRAHSHALHGHRRSPEHLLNTNFHGQGAPYSCMGPPDRRPGVPDRPVRVHQSTAAGRSRACSPAKRRD